MSEAGHHHGLDASSPARYRASVRVTLVSVAANLLLTAAQLVIGWIGHSQALHLLRTRRVGGEALVDVHIIVGERLSVSEGHQISEAVRTRLIGEIDAVADVMVHIDTEEDVAGASCARLPLRDEVLARLAGRFRDTPEARLIEATTLHYLNGRLAIELLLPLTAVSGIGPARALAARLRAAVGADPEIGTLDVQFH
jgi:hypothetical protein